LPRVGRHNLLILWINLRLKVVAIASRVTR
jgi:hypothetical protein